MITRTPEIREQYEARLKAKLDEEARLEYARSEGEQIGQQRGELIGQQRGELIGQHRGELIGQHRGEPIGQIRLLERILDTTPTASEELAKLSLEQLASRLAELERIFHERKG